MKGKLKWYNRHIMKNTVIYLILLAILLLPTATYGSGQGSVIVVHPGSGIDLVKIGTHKKALEKLLPPPLFTEYNGSTEISFFSYKNAILGVTISKKKNTVEEIKLIPLIGDISVRGTVTSKSSLNDVLTAFGPLNIKETEEGVKIKCFSVNTEPSPYNPTEHLMEIAYLNEGIKFEFLIAEKNMLSAIKISKVKRCIKAKEIENH